MSEQPFALIRPRLTFRVCALNHNGRHETARDALSNTRREAEARRAQAEGRARGRLTSAAPALRAVATGSCDGARGVARLQFALAALFFGACSCVCEVGGALRDAHRSVFR